MVPAVVYGRAVEPKSIWINLFEFRRLINKSGESTIISLDIDGKETRDVLVYDIQRDPVKNVFIHVDFFQVRMDEEIETEVELEYVGEAPAVKELGGVLVKNMTTLEVRCLPADLPSSIQVDISLLKTFEDHVCIKDLGLSKKIEIGIDEETVLALVTPPRSESELSDLEKKVEGDVSKVEGVVKETPTEETEPKK